MRELVISAGFEKKLKKFRKAHPDLRLILIQILKTLPIDPIPKKYKAHKLGGPLAGCLAVSINMSYRLIYTFNKDNVYLLNIGSHEVVYE